VGGLGRLERYFAAGALVVCQFTVVSMTPHPTWSLHPKLGGTGRTVVAAPATMVGAVTGRTSVNRTDERWQITGTDLGILWEGSSGDVLAAFGDTFGGGWSGHGSLGTPAANAWRSNTLAHSADRELADGMTVDGFATDAGRPHTARELLSSHKVDGHEMTVVPTAGIAVDGRDYVHYMSVRQWVTHGEWITNHAGIAWSDDGGDTWVKDPDAVWPAAAGFQMGAFARWGDHVYLFGTPAGRGGDVHLARVPPDRVLTPAAYRYWDGTAWSPDVSRAVPVVAAPVGELSVQYNDYLERWVMLHVQSPPDRDVRSIVLRTAPALTGPWTAPQDLATSRDHPGLYGGFIHPWSSDADLYFTMSLWEPYNVYLMRTTLALEPMG